VRRASGVLSAASVSDAYRNMVAVTPDARLAGIVRGDTGARRANREWPAENFQGRSIHEAMMLTDLLTYLPDDILTKVDRTSMAHSLEARVPLLDVGLVELAVSLPVSLRLSGGPKGLLKNVLKRYVPEALVDRPKHGFGIPIHDWLRGNLRDCLMDYLSQESLRRHNLFDSDVVERIAREHVDLGQNRGYTLWALLMFQMWHEHFYRAQPWRFEPSRAPSPAAG
jgi:asparagine synthase (glutamine-hydrolysing)